jgi:hypothetical protein
MDKDYKGFQTQRAILIEYLQVMIARNDWHGVADVAMDLREMEAEQRRIFAYGSEWKET